MCDFNNNGVLDAFDLMVLDELTKSKDDKTDDTTKKKGDKK